MKGNVTLSNQTVPFKEKRLKEELISIRKSQTTGDWGAGFSLSGFVTLMVYALVKALKPGFNDFALIPLFLFGFVSFYHLYVFIELKGKGYQFYKMSIEDIETLGRLATLFISPFLYLIMNTFTTLTNPTLEFLSDLFCVFPLGMVSFNLFGIVFLTYSIIRKDIEKKKSDSMNKDVNITISVKDEHRLSFEENKVDQTEKHVSKASDSFEEFPYLATSSYLKLSQLILPIRHEIELLNQRLEELKELDVKQVHKMSKMIYYFNDSLTSFEKLHPSEQDEMVQYLFSYLEAIQKQVNVCWDFIRKEHISNIIKNDLILSYEIDENK